MKISYNWLKNYIDLRESPDEVADILTQTGLEVAAVEEYESIRGSMKGLVVGLVVTCEKHPNSDHLSKTTVDIGEENLLNIICGAPNVAANQKVVVAPIGTTLYIDDQELLIKRAKIRGEVSEGMICAEDEIGIGTDHTGIIVLPEDAVVGSEARNYFDVESDSIIEVDITPNRIDGASHIGAARDLAAFISCNSRPVTYKKESVNHFQTDNQLLDIAVEIKNREACKRYSGVTISGVEVKESPDWLKNRLKAIGHNPINNVVDITNYVLFETGQPLHAFDADHITTNRVVIQTLPSGTKFTTLDGEERELNNEDLMICNGDEPMCIGGVFGGIDSGVSETTRNIFLESAWFDSVSIRKTARRHGLHTDASFHFERGTDPEGVIYALKRAALLIKEIAGGTISSDIKDEYPEKAEHREIEVSFKNINNLTGVTFDRESVRNILKSLEIAVLEENEHNLLVKVPPYRVDVTREVDIIEEILRIYGYNRVEIPSSIHSSIQYTPYPNPTHLRNITAEMLTAQGFFEIWTNSLTKKSYYQGLNHYSEERCVTLLNPLSTDLNGMRQTLLFGGLESIAHNINRQSRNLQLYEFGNCYFFSNDNQKEDPLKRYSESEFLGIWITGEKRSDSWVSKSEPVSFFQLKSISENILSRMGFNIRELKTTEVADELYSYCLEYKERNRTILKIGQVSNKILKQFEIEQPVYFADIVWNKVLEKQSQNEILFKELPKFPEVRRDLALVLDQSISFHQIEELAYKIERKTLQKVGLFDVYTGIGVPQGKKSYAVSFILRDDKSTLNDKQIDKTMQRLIAAFERELSAELRK